MRTILILTSLCFSVTGLSAQSFYIPNNNAGGGVACNAAPFLSSDYRYQTLIRASDLNNTPVLIHGFGLAPCAQSGPTATFSRLMMKMAHDEDGSSERRDALDDVREQPRGERDHGPRCSELHLAHDRERLERFRSSAAVRLQRRRQPRRRNDRARPRRRSRNLSRRDA